MTLPQTRLKTIVTVSTVDSTSLRIIVSALTIDGAPPILYSIQRSLNGASRWEEIYSGAPSTYTDSGLEPSKTYYYRARFTQADSTVSNWSEVARGTTTADVEIEAPIPATALDYPRIGLYWIDADFDVEMGGFFSQYQSPKGIDIMSKMHLVIMNGWPELSGWRNYSNHQIARSVKEASTADTKIFMYFDTESSPRSGSAYVTRQNKIRNENWYVYETGTVGFPRSSFLSAYNHAINPTTKVRRDIQGRTAIEWMADYEPTWIWGGAENNAESDLIDGVLLDNCLVAPRINADFDLGGSINISYRGADTDWKQTRPDTALLYQSGVATGINRFKTNYPTKKILGNIADLDIHETIGLGSLNTSPYWKSLHGGVVPGVLGTSYSTESRADTNTFVQSIQAIEDFVIQPELCLFQAISDDGVATNYQALRHALAACLVLTNMCFSFQVDDNQGKVIWYDEYDFDLGKPLEPRQTTERLNGIWRRDFENGIVIWAPKGAEGNINLGGTFYRFRGNQAPDVNSGSPVTNIDYGPKDITIWGENGLQLQSVSGRDGVILSRTPT